MKLWIVFILMALVLAGGILIGMIVQAHYTNERIPYAYTYACAEGCSNMQEQFYNVSGFDYDDLGNKSMHDKCFGRCFDMYVNQRG